MLFFSRIQIIINLFFFSPNAVDCDIFKPDYDRVPLKGNIVTIVIGSRLVYRKGIDFVSNLLPKMCQRTFKEKGVNYKVNFIIGGDGDKRILLEETIEINGLQSRVEMLGELSHSGKNCYCLFLHTVAN